jgi:hypothetical protein
MRNKIVKVEKVSLHRPTKTMVEIGNILTTTICDPVWTIDTNLHSQDIAIKM